MELTTSIYLLTEIPSTLRVSPSGRRQDAAGSGSNRKDNNGHGYSPSSSPSIHRGKSINISVHQPRGRDTVISRRNNMNHELTFAADSSFSPSSSLSLHFDVYRPNYLLNLRHRTSCPCLWPMIMSMLSFIWNYLLSNFNLLAFSLFFSCSYSHSSSFPFTYLSIERTLLSINSMLESILYHISYAFLIISTSSSSIMLASSMASVDTIDAKEMGDEDRKKKSLTKNLFDSSPIDTLTIDRNNISMNSSCCHGHKEECLHNICCTSSDV